MATSGGRPARYAVSGRTGRTVAGAALGWVVLGLAGGVAGAPPAAAASHSALAAAAVPAGPQLFVGDFETGDFSQWGTCQTATVNSGCAGFARGDRTMRIVTDDVRQGRYAAQFDLRPGDVPDFGGGERAEVQSDASGAVVHEGDERWYQWSMKFPADFENPTGVWFIVMQWHAGRGSPPLAINISNDGTVDIGGDGLKGEPRRTIGPVRRGEWVDYTLHVKFSRDRSGGFVEAWENDEQTVPRTARASMTSDENYLKQGIYRDSGPATSVRIDGLRVTAPGVTLP